MVTKQQQLEFAAEHIEKWKSGYSYAVVEKATDGHLYVRWPTICTSGITKKEWRQERDKMQKQAEQSTQDNSWHERGELPPVGCECLWVDESGVDGPDGAIYPCVGDVVSVCAHKQTPGGDVIAIFTWASCGDELRVAASRMSSDFRPLRSEREKAIDGMIEVTMKSETLSNYAITSDVLRVVSERLYDAGYRKAAT